MGRPNGTCGWIFWLLLSLSLHVVLTRTMLSPAAHLTAFPSRIVRDGAPPVLAVLFLCTALASYYMDQYTVFLNKEMLRNILRTDPAEAGELLTLHLVPHLLLYAALPITLLALTRVAVRPLSRAMLVRADTFCSSFM